MSEGNGTVELCVTTCDDSPAQRHFLLNATTQNSIAGIYIICTCTYIHISIGNLYMDIAKKRLCYVHEHNMQNGVSV